VCQLLLIQQNINGSNFFNRSWAEFKVGFGDPSGNYWLGNDRLSELTRNNSYKMMVDVQLRRTDEWYSAEYSQFIVAPAKVNYRLLVDGRSGHVSNYFGQLNGTMFTTYDKDNDGDFWANCALADGGGFWYNPSMGGGSERCPQPWSLQVDGSWRTWVRRTEYDPYVAEVAGV